MRSKKGYTIIELVVVMGIIAIVMTLMFPSFGSYSRRRSLQQGVNVMKQAVDEARLSAAAPAQGLDTDPATGKDGYQVTFKINDTSQEQVAVCPSSATTIETFDDCRNVKQIALPKGVNVVAVGWWNGIDADPMDADPTDDIPLSLTQLSFKFKFIGEKEINGGVSPSTLLSAGTNNYLIIRLQNLKNGDTKDLVMNLLTGFMYAWG